MENLLPTASIRDVAFILFKRKWSILVILLGTLLGSVVYLWFIRGDVYAVTGRVLVKLGREQAPPPTVLGAGPMVIGYRKDEVNSELEIIQSAQLIGAVIDDLHLDRPSPPDPPPPGLIANARYHLKDYVKRYQDWQDEFLISAGVRERLTPREKVLSLLQAGFNVKAAKDSNVFVAALGTPYRKGGGMVLNALLDKYLVYRQQVYRSQGLNFFNDEVDRSLIELRTSETQLQHFENTQGISLLGKQEEELLAEISKERELLRESDIQRNESQFKVERLQAELQKREPNFGYVGDFPRESLQHNILSQLAELQREREKLRLTELDAGERIQNNRQQFQILSNMLAANLSSSLAEREAIIAAHRTSLRRLEGELESRHGKTAEWLGLKRKVGDLEGNYMVYRKKLTESRADTDMQEVALGNVVIIERPIDPISPVGLRKTTLLGICMLVAIFVALAWVALVEFFDNNAYTAEQTSRYLAAPVLAEIPL